MYFIYLHHSQESIFRLFFVICFDIFGILYILYTFHNNIDNNVSLLRNVLGTKKLGDILSERESIANEMQDLLLEATEPWGVTVERVEVQKFHLSDHCIEVFLITIKVPDHCIEIQVKDVRVPAQLMRAMAAEAEAAREARAKVIIIIIIMIIYCKSY